MCLPTIFSWLEVIPNEKHSLEASNSIFEVIRSLTAIEKPLCVWVLFLSISFMAHTHGPLCPLHIALPAQVEFQSVWVWKKFMVENS